MIDTTHYQSLGLPTDATADDIKRAYRKMARKYHPDVNSGAEADAKFKAAGAAYEVLSDPEKRAAYDRYGADWDQPHPEPGQDARWEGGFAFDERDVNPEMFREFFGQRFGGGPMRRDQHAQLCLTSARMVCSVRRSTNRVLCRHLDRVDISAKTERRRDHRQLVWFSDDRGKYRRWRDPSESDASCADFGERS